MRVKGPDQAKSSLSDSSQPDRFHLKLATWQNEHSQSNSTLLSKFQTEPLGMHKQRPTPSLSANPFKGRDLATVTTAELKAVQNMREAAEAAEVDQFNKQVSAASGDAATALQNGKIKNKVLKLTGEVQAIQIKGKIAQGKAAGKDTTSDETKLKEEQTKLAKNIATDVKNKGKASKGVA